MKKKHLWTVIIVVVIAVSAVLLLPKIVHNQSSSTLQVGIRSDAESAYDSDGMNVIWTVKNVGDHSVSFDKNAIAQILLNGEKYEFETEPITLEVGEEYSVEISIPYPVARQEMNNNLKITAETTGGTKATYKQSFEH